MLMHTREGTTIVTQQEMVKNETRRQMNNLFQRLCSVQSFLLSRKYDYSFATGSFHFRTGQAKLSKAHFYLMHFLKVRHFPEKLTTNRFLEFFLKLLSRYNRLSKQSFVRFLYGAGRLATSSFAWPLRSQKSLPHSLWNSLNSILRWFQWFFRTFVIF